MQKLNQNILFPNQNINDIQIKTKQYHIDLKCTKNNKLYYFCINTQCKQKNSFFCQNSLCKCKQNHNNCEKFSIKNILNKISSKSIQNTINLKNAISDIFVNIFGKLSEFQQKLIKKVQNQFKNDHLMNLQKKFYQGFTQSLNENINDFNSKKLSDLCQMLAHNSKIHKLTQNLIKDFVKQVKQFEKDVIQTIQKVNQSINKFYNDFINLKQHESFLMTNKTQFVYQQSSIIRNCIQSLKLINFFQNNPKSINLKFKASENDFRMPNFYQKCGNLSKIIIVCQTTKNKIIGGYTPLSFNPKNYKQSVVYDNTRSSFIFSLTQNDKFQLGQSNFALLCKHTGEICFSGGSFRIYTDGNENTHNWTMLNHNCYVNQKYKNDKQSYLRLNGNQSSSFKIKQWEVFQVQF